MAKRRDFNPDPLDLGRNNPTKRPVDKNANYNFADQQDPKRPMGHGSYANMPDHPIMLPFAKEGTYRDGIINNFNQGIEEVSDLYENHSKPIRVYKDR